MAYLTKFGIKNFRVFKDMTDFEFAPITILTGTNSSGKSSLIKALLLLKDNYAESLKGFYPNSTVEHSLPEIDKLEFTGTDHKLPGFESCLNSKSGQPEIVFKFPIDLGFGEESCLELYYRNNTRETSTSGDLYSVKIFTFKNSVLLFDLNKDDQSEWNFYINYAYIMAKIDLLAKKQKENEKTEKSEKRIESQNNNRLKELHLKKHEGASLTDEELQELSELEGWRSASIATTNEYLYSGSLFSCEMILYHKLNDLPAFAIKLNLGKHNSNDPFHPFYFNTNITDKSIFLESITENDIDYFRSRIGENTEELEGNFIYEFLNKQAELFTFALFEYLKRSSAKEINSLNDLRSSLKNGEIAYYQFVNKNTSNLGKFEKDDKTILQFYSNPNSFESQLNQYTRRLSTTDIQSLYSNEKTYTLFDQINSAEKEGKIDLENRADIYVYLLAMSFQQSYYKEKPDFQIAFNFVYSSKIFKNYAELMSTKFHYFEEIVLGSFKKAVRNALFPLTRLYFTEAVRANTQRAYSFNSQGASFNELLIDFESLDLPNDSSEISFINKWLNQFCIGEKLYVKQNNEGLGTQVYIDGCPLADLGYGVTQFLPLLLKICLVARKHIELPIFENEPCGYYSSILIIEEPETNLHPKLQSLLADMIVDAAKKFHIQFIIETHSEYLIRKLQYLTANKEHKYNINPEDTAIYYFNDPKTLKKGENQVRRINIRQDGILDGSFGPGFFDEASNLIMDIINISKSN